MFTIDGNNGYYDYEKILRQLQRVAANNDWLVSLSAWEREIILDHILRKVTFISPNAR